MLLRKKTSELDQILTRGSIKIKSSRRNTEKAESVQSENSHD